MSIRLLLILFVLQSFFSVEKNCLANNASLANEKCAASENLISKKEHSVANHTFQYIDEKGDPAGELAEVLQILEVDLDEFCDSEEGKLNPSIFKAVKFLEQFYRKDRDFYRKGGTSAYNLSIDVAKQINSLFRGKSARLIAEDPCKKEAADVVIFGGTDWSLEKRIQSLEKFLERGYPCDTVYILSRTKELERYARTVVERHAELWEKRKVEFVDIPDLEDLAVKNASPRFKDYIFAVKQHLKKGFYVVSDPEYYHILQKSLCCLFSGNNDQIEFFGVFARPITTDPEDYVLKDMKGYRFEEFLKEHEDQIRAMALSCLNLLIHQVTEEIKIFSEER